MNDKLKGDDIACCRKCGEIATQALDVETDKNRMVTSRAYYIHCFDGDCGNEGPRTPTSDESIERWNAQQVSP